MTQDELEFSISQYLDGTLGARERDALDERLATDAEARSILAEYESLETVLAAAPLPDVRWDALAAQISAAVAREEMPAQSYKLNRWFRPARLAVAASVLVAAGIAFSMLRPGGESRDGGVARPGPQVAAEPVRIVRVDAQPTGETVADAAPNATPVTTAPPAEQVVRVAIGPASSAEGRPQVRRYADSVVRRPSKALIVSAVPPGQDTPQTPY